MKALIVILGVMTGTNAFAQASYDPVTQDPVMDAKNPPTMVELQIAAEGGNLMNGHLYIANGAGPHPTVVFLHGFPGNEKNLDLAQVLRRAGFNTLYFHYRGAWGSGGQYGLGNQIDDTASVIKFLRAEAAEGNYRIDPDHISVVGHSLGGMNALITGIEQPDVQCTVAIAPANTYPRAKEIIESGVDLPDTPVAGLGGYTAGALMRETLANPARFNYLANMGAYKGRPLLMISGLKDDVLPPETQTPIASAAQGAEPFAHIMLDGDHSFSSKRITLAHTLVDWMSTNCR